MLRILESSGLSMPFVRPTLLEKRVEVHLALGLAARAGGRTGPERALTQFSVCSRLSAGRRPDVIGCRRTPRTPRKPKSLPP